MQSRPKFYYGWIIVVTLGVIGGISTFIGVGNFGVFVVPMKEELQIGNSYFGWALSARLIGFAISGPIIGRCIDCLLYTSPSPRDGLLSRMPSSA